MKHIEPGANSGARPTSKTWWAPISPQVKSLCGITLIPLGAVHLARWCEVRGWIPSVSLACWEGDLEIKHSAPSADSGARAPLRLRCVFGCRFAPEKSPPRDHSGTAGGLIPLQGLEVRGWIPSPSLACSEGDLELKHSEPSADSVARAPSGQDVFLGADLPPKTALREIRARCLGASLGALVRS